MWQDAVGAFKAFNPVITQLCCFCFMVRRFGVCSFCLFLSLLRSRKGMEWLRIPMMQQLAEKAVGAVRGYVMQFVTWWHGRKLPQPSLNCCCVKSIGKHIVEWNTLIATDLTVILSTGPLNQPSLPCRDPAVLWSSHRHKSVLHGDTTVWSTCILHLVTYTQIWYIFICVYDCVCHACTEVCTPCFLMFLGLCLCICILDGLSLCLVGLGTKGLLHPPWLHYGLLHTRSSVAGLDATWLVSPACEHNGGNWQHWGHQRS